MQLEQSRELHPNRSAVKNSETCSSQSVNSRQTRKTREEAAAKPCETRVDNTDDTRRVCSSTDSGRSSISSSQTSNGEETQEKASTPVLTEILKTGSNPLDSVQSTNLLAKELEKEKNEDIDMYADVTLVPKSMEPIRIVTKIGKPSSKRLQRNKPAQSMKTEKTKNETLTNKKSNTNEDKSVNSPHSQDLSTTNHEVSSTTDIEPSGMICWDTQLRARTHKVIDRNSKKLHSERSTTSTEVAPSNELELITEDRLSSSISPIRSVTPNRSEDPSLSNDNTEHQNMKRYYSACELQVSAEEVEQTADQTSKTFINPTPNGKVQSTLTVLIKRGSPQTGSPDISPSSPSKSPPQIPCPNKCNSRELLDVDVRKSDSKLTSFSTSSSPIPSIHSGCKPFLSNRRRGRQTSSPVHFQGNTNGKALLSHKSNRSFCIQPLVASDELNSHPFSCCGQVKKTAHDGARRSVTSPALLPSPLVSNGNCFCLQPLDTSNLPLNQNLCWWFPGMNWNQFSEETANTLGKSADFRHMIPISQAMSVDNQTLNEKANFLSEQTCHSSKNDDASNVGNSRTVTPLILANGSGRVYMSSPKSIHTVEQQQKESNAEHQQTTTSENNQLLIQCNANMTIYNQTNNESLEKKSNVTIDEKNGNLVAPSWNGNMNNPIPPTFEPQLIGYSGTGDPCILPSQFVYFYNADGQLFAMPSSAFFYPTASTDSNMSSADASFNSPLGQVVSLANNDLQRFPINGSKMEDRISCSFDLTHDSGQIQAGYINLPTQWPGLTFPLDGATPTSVPIPINTTHRPIFLNTTAGPLLLQTPCGTNSSSGTRNTLNGQCELNNKSQTDRQRLSQQTVNETGSRLSKGYVESTGLLGPATTTGIYYGSNNTSILGDTKPKHTGEETGRLGYHAGTSASRTKKHSSKTNLYIRGLPPTFTEDQLHTLAPEQELIRSVKLIAGTEGEMYGFIDFTSNAAARNALLHIKSTNRELYVNFAYESEKDPQNVYITNIPETWTASNVEDLKKLFQQYGPIATAIVMTKRSNNFCTGAGFVRFVKAEDAQKAIEGIRQAQLTLEGGKGPLEVKLADRQKPQDDQTIISKVRSPKLSKDGVPINGQETRSEHSQEPHHRQNYNLMHRRNASCLLPGESVPPLLGSTSHSLRQMHGQFGMGLLSTPDSLNSCNYSTRVPNPTSVSMALHAALASNPFINQNIYMQSHLNALNLQVALGPDNSTGSQSGLMSYPTTLPPLPGLLSQTRAGSRNASTVTTTPGLFQSQPNPSLFPTPTNLIPILRMVDDSSFPAGSINFSGTPHSNLLGHAMHPPSSWGASPMISGLFASM